MRIISGTLKGRKFKVPSNFPVRPTTDFAREGLFNMLQHQLDFEGLKVLDLCCGTGSISLECWSRGARDILAVDQHNGCCRYLVGLTKELELKGLKVYRSEILDLLKKDLGAFDFIFADPPYDFPNYTDIPKLVFERNWLSPEGLLVVEHGKRTDLSTLKGYDDTRRYGNVHFSFFRHPAIP